MSRRHFLDIYDHMTCGPAIPRKGRTGQRCERQWQKSKAVRKPWKEWEKQIVESYQHSGWSNYRTEALQKITLSKLVRTFWHFRGFLLPGFSYLCFKVPLKKKKKKLVPPIKVHLDKGFTTSRRGKKK